MEAAVIRRQDRREGPRLRSDVDHRIRGVRIRPGHSATLVDVSARGALVETSRRLIPGTHVELHIDLGPSHRIVVKARVLRSTVSRLCASTVAYRGAVLFDRHLPWFVDEAGM